MNVFLAADILLPKVESMEKWSVIACDQFTSDPEYWQRVSRLTKDSPSTYNLVLPESELGTCEEETHSLRINRNMKDYLGKDIFREIKNSYIYVERTLDNGAIRKGIVGMVDLDAYDFNSGSGSLIRATEKTVIERIPPRVKIRHDADIEFPHIIMLCDDNERVLIEPVTAKKDSFEKVYDFNLMEGGNHIAGWLVDETTAREFDERFTDYSSHIGEKYVGLKGVPMVLAAGDGNHSLATAKTCYEELKAANPGVDLSNHPARYALVELENLHDEAQQFEPIHRIVTGCDADKLLADLKNDICASEGFAVKWFTENAHETIYLDKNKGELAIAVLQSWLDKWLIDNAGEIDYIHDDDALITLAKQKNSVGFLLPDFEKSQLFRGVIAGGSLPRKTFSMGHSHEKRYYLEGRKIK